MHNKSESEATPIQLQSRSNWGLEMYFLQWMSIGDANDYIGN